MMQTRWVGEVLDLSPIGSCQELSEDRIQTPGQERPGQPAVTSLTLAETIHLAEGGPPRDRGREEPVGPRATPRLERGSGRVSCAHGRMRTAFIHVNRIHAPLYAHTTRHARAILSHHQHNLLRCPRESFPQRQIREAEVTCCHKS